MDKNNNLDNKKEVTQSETTGNNTSANNNETKGYEYSMPLIVSLSIVGFLVTFFTIGAGYKILFMDGRPEGMSFRMNENSSMNRDRMERIEGQGQGQNQGQGRGQRQGQNQGQQGQQRSGEMNGMNDDNHQHSLNQ